jgi:predicted ArsR family transcriptional regulator
VSERAIVGDVQEQARALGDPTRHAIFRLVVESSSPVTVAELTDRLQLNHNAVRQHLAKLVAAGLLVESRATPSGPGRPRLLYSVHPSAESRWGATGPYERLSLLLAEVIRTGDTPLEVGRRAGRRATAEHPDEAPSIALAAVAARGGFAPTLHQRGDDVEVLLNACPFASAATAAPEIVCQLHHGIAIGVAEAVGGITIDGLDREDPRDAPCRLRAHLDRTITVDGSADDRQGRRR